MFIFAPKVTDKALSCWNFLDIIFSLCLICWFLTWLLKSSSLLNYNCSFIFFIFIFCSWTRSFLLLKLSSESSSSPILVLLYNLRVFSVLFYFLSKNIFFSVFDLSINSFLTFVDNSCFEFSHFLIGLSLCLTPINILLAWILLRSISKSNLTLSTSSFLSFFL